jgi:predicted aldo/keto reductase-like oxidoreductase
MKGNLGFGCMRLPVIGGNTENIDIEQFGRMADEFIDNGFTYFDTSYVYHNGKSEAAVREAVVKRHPRDSFTVATKFPTFIPQNEDQVGKIFEEQLSNLGVDYVDYYLLHALNRKMYDGPNGNDGPVKKFHLFEHAKKWKEEGKIRHLGFSFHDSPEMLDRILTDHPEVEFVQIIINYYDWDSYFIRARRCYETIRKHGKKVVIMEPVKGGYLAKVPEKTAAAMEASMPGASPASWAVRFAGSLDGVIAVLSGMSDTAQAADNIKTMKDMKPIDEDDRALLREAVTEMKKGGPLGESDYSRYEGAEYNGVSVAALLDTYNTLLMQPDVNFAADNNYIAMELYGRGVTDLKQDFPEEKVIAGGEDITAKVKEAWDCLIDHATVL